MRWSVAVLLLLITSLVVPAVAQEEEMPQTEEPAMEEVEAPPAEVPTAAPPPPTPVPPPPAPTATVQPPSGPGTVLLSDDFNDPTRAQLPLAPTGAERSQGYIGGEYEIINGDTQATSVEDVLVPGSYQDTSIAIDVRVYGGIPRLRGAHIVCRGVGVGTGYVLALYPEEQRFALLRRQPSMPNSPVVLLEQRGLGAIRPGEGVNRLELSCVGPTITGSVNGVVVATVQDPTFAAGRHAIGVRGSGTTARFDNLVVTQR